MHSAAAIPSFPDAGFEPLEAVFDGTIHLDEACRREAGTDFGKLAFSVPLAVLKPGNSAAVIAAVKFASNHGLKIIAKGTAHTTFGQSQCQGGLVLDMAGMSKVLAIDPAAAEPWMDVAPGIHWEAVIKFAAAHLLALPVTTDWQKMSVGGTIATGGIGFNTHRYGLITDNIPELDVVDGAGTQHTCSATQNTLLFDAVRAGLGQYGFITRVRLRLMPMPRQAHIYRLFFPDAEHFSRAVQEAVAGRYFEGIHAFVIPNTEKDILAKIEDTGSAALAFAKKLAATGTKWVYFTEFVKYDEPQQAASDRILRALAPFGGKYFATIQAHLAYLTKEPPLIVLERALGKNPHPQLIVIQPAASFCKFMDDTLAGLEHADMGEGPILIMPIDPEAARSPMFKRPATGFSWFTGFLKNAYPGTASQVADFCNKNMVTYRQAVQLGGNRHPSDSLSIPNNSAGWEKHYGAELWQRAITAKRMYDPENLFVSRLNLFDDILLA